MVKLMLAAIIFSAPLAAVAADGQSDGGYVAPELTKPAPGQLLDQDYLTSTWGDCRAARRSAVVG